jgi:hypothetical protein
MNENNNRLYFEIACHSKRQCRSVFDCKKDGEIYKAQFVHKHNELMARTQKNEKTRFGNYYLAQTL